jgi:hypothetical protein
LTERRQKEPEVIDLTEADVRAARAREAEESLLAKAREEASRIGVSPDQIALNAAERLLLAPDASPGGEAKTKLDALRLFQRNQRETAEKAFREAFREEEQESAAGKRAVVKLTVKIPVESMNTLREMAHERGTTITETIRQMIQTERHLQDAVAQGGKILIEYPDKGIRELIFR